MCFNSPLYFIFSFNVSFPINLSLSLMSTFPNLADCEKSACREGKVTCLQTRLVGRKKKEGQVERDPVVGFRKKMAQ